MWVPSVDWEDPLEKSIETHCSILAWRIPWTEEPGGLQSLGSQRVRHDRETNTSLEIVEAGFEVAFKFPEFQRKDC